MKLIIDRIENNIAVCLFENGTTAEAPVCIFAGAKEGDVVNISIDSRETKKRKEIAQSKLNNLFEKKE